MLPLRLLTQGDDRAGFDCGVAALNVYLKTRAGQDMRRGIARVFVAVVEADAKSDKPSKIAGFYTLSAASVQKADMPKAIAKKLPNYPVPCALLGRVAVDLSWQGRGLGQHLLFDTFHRTIHASDVMGIHSLLVDAKDSVTAVYYQRFGFASFPNRPLQLFIPVDTLRKAFQAHRIR